ncbi:MAG TPA: hypothetical protein P5076_22775, partial [Myxococcota bacterium]|nr:hypothetical protein [Myxococcota bacterium]
FPRPGAGHSYWEVRFDTRVSREAWALAKRLSTRAHPDHDRHLRALLQGPLFPFAVQKQMFIGFVAFTRLLRWRRMAAAIDRRSPRQLTDEQVREARDLCVARVLDLLTHGRVAACVQADPTGLRNLRIAAELRERLHDLAGRGRLADPQGIAARFRPLFREAIDQKLSLPSLLELAAPGPASPWPPPRRGLMDGRAARTREERRARQRRRQRERQGTHEARAVARAAYASVEQAEERTRRETRASRRAEARASRAERRRQGQAARAARSPEQEARAVAEAAYQALREASRAAAASQAARRRRFPRARALARALLTAMRLKRRRPAD